MSSIEISHTLEVVCKSWEAAEEAMRDNIRRHAPGLDETEITSRFHEDFARQLDEASVERRIETAFLQDLRVANRFHQFDESELRRISTGLLAQVTLHPGETERRTGGDVGVVVVRPKVSSGYDSLEVSARHRRGQRAALPSKVARVQAALGCADTQSGESAAGSVSRASPI